jgi:hypothetical protein
MRSEGTPPPLFSIYYYFEKIKKIGGIVEKLQNLFYITGEIDELCHAKNFIILWTRNRIINFDSSG